MWPGAGFVRSQETADLGEKELLGCTTGKKVCPTSLRRGRSNTLIGTTWSGGGASARRGGAVQQAFCRPGIGWDAAEGATN